ncbi:SDR family NAD(P)-dependent oxidoreductase [Marinilongibacter aquaticus]|uniref:SDR family oxidoreductase n=1 Tax=Marinilongibacter aquaticus TaxID=2975157 RepID=UPI0021BD5974|nr:SDR family NAD(P)-dependent oxidoreductase [Marinilongibacter aquaticus]UBM59246.1 SDR family NAD(P)-dependent oxidoreductase [Marinilongibacter aquaticus]
MKLNNNTILITGGSSGIGLELAKKLMDLQNKVIITGRDEEKLKEAQRALPGLEIFQSDVSQLAAIEALYKAVIAAFPNLNILINNAGIMRNLDLQDAENTPENINREIEINLSGPIRMTQQFLPHLKKQAEAAIVNVSSGLAYVSFSPSPVYSATKAGLHSYSQALRMQLQNTQIKVFEIAPPATSTSLMDRFSADLGPGSSGPIMDTEKMVKVAIRGMQRDTFEIRPGMSKALFALSRLVPNFAVGMLHKSVERNKKA